jgi:hypothetical protein
MAMSEERDDGRPMPVEQLAESIAEGRISDMPKIAATILTANGFEVTPEEVLQMDGLRYPHLLNTFFGVETDRQADEPRWNSEMMRTWASLIPLQEDSARYKAMHDAAMRRAAAAPGKVPPKGRPQKSFVPELLAIASMWVDAHGIPEPRARLARFISNVCDARGWEYSETQCKKLASRAVELWKTFDSLNRRFADD